MRRRGAVNQNLSFEFYHKKNNNEIKSNYIKLKMSLPPLFPKATTAGIVKTSDGDRVVASSRRPDGT